VVTPVTAPVAAPEPTPTPAPVTAKMESRSAEPAPAVEETVEDIQDGCFSRLMECMRKRPR
jgi:hypothetical protein